MIQDSVRNQLQNLSPNSETTCSGLKSFGRNLSNPIESMDVESSVSLIQDPESLETALSQLNDESEKGVFLSRIGASLLKEYAQTGSNDNLLYAIAMEEKALELISSESPDRAVVLTNLGIALQWRFERMGLMKDLDRAIDTSEQAVVSTPVNDPNRAGRLNNLGSALRSRYERMGSMEDLAHVIDASEKIVESTPMNRPDRGCVSQ
jgi:hypothetical protein